MQTVQSIIVVSKRNNTLLAYKSNKPCDVTELQCNNNYDPLMTLL